MLPTIRFIAYEIDSKVCFFSNNDKVRKDIPIKSWLIIPDNDIDKVKEDRSLMIPEIFMQ